MIVEYKKGEIMNKRILASIISLCMLVNISVVTAEANGSAQGNVDLANGSLVIDETGYTQGNTSAISYTGAYTITQTGGSTANTITVESGATANITISGVNIIANDTSAIKVEKDAVLYLTLEGTNSVTGADCYAGIAVVPYFDDEWNYSAENSGRLIILGDGTLTAKGGKATTTNGAGAGIGGDGYGENGNHDGGNFGTVTIQSGTIHAVGGTALSVSFGSGAGIGSGGICMSNVFSPAGSIHITGGNITSQGGDDSLASRSAAGIGCGGNDGTHHLYGENMTISITGGAVKATGGTGAAGIGGSSNGSSGSISIGGNAQVTATGRADSVWGGAGIGAGDNGYSEPIVIQDNASVTAVGGGAAAGIGSGGNSGGGATTITIRDNASVTASSTYGAGIGGGWSSYWDAARNCGTVTLNSTGTIVAYGGHKSQAIGMGGSNADYAFPNQTSNELIIGEDTGEVWMFVAQASTPAFFGQNQSADYFSTASGKTAIWYTHIGTEDFPVSENAGSSDEAEYAWKNETQTLTITSDGAQIASYTYKDGYTLSNWAYFGKGADTQPTITSIEIKTLPKLCYTEGEMLDLSDLMLTVVYSDGSETDVPYSAAEMETSIINGTILTVASHNGQNIILTYQGKTMAVGTLTVTEKGSEEPENPDNPPQPETPSEPLKPTDPDKENPDTEIKGDQTGDKDNPSTGTTESPQTGYDSNIALWIAVMLAVGAALTGTAAYSRKRKYSK